MLSATPITTNFSTVNETGTYTPVNCNLGYGCQISYLFDGLVQNEATAINACSWAMGGYITLTLNQKSNIYRIAGNYTEQFSTLPIYKLQDGVFTEVTSSYTIPLACGYINTWQKFVSEIPAGTYRFGSGNGLQRFDSEWYIENIEDTYIIKSANNYYSIKKDYYDTTLKQYVPLGNPVNIRNGFYYLKDLFSNVTIDGETFKPIDKFNNMQIVTNKSTRDFNLKGLTTKNQLVVANDDIPISIASNIDSLTLSYNKSSNADIKIVLSTDKGITWKTWNTTTSTFDLVSDLVIPCKSYSKLSNTEKELWNNAIQTILTTGIPVSTFNTLNFNLLPSKTVRFAYVLYRPTFLDVAETSELDWQFDAKGFMQKMTDSEHIVNAYEHEIKVTTLINNPLIKVNIMT